MDLIRQEAPSGGRSTVELSIEGMTCASCVGTITNMLQNVRGVESYHIDLIERIGYHRGRRLGHGNNSTES
jgi:Cu+-exporting ATPase